MALLMDWIEGLINDEDVFPTRVGESRLAGRSGSFFTFCFVFSEGLFLSEARVSLQGPPRQDHDDSQNHPEQVPQGALASHPVWANMTCCGLRESFLTPGPKKGKTIWTGGQTVAPLQWALRTEFFHFRPVREPCLSSAGQPGRVRVGRR